MSGRASLATLRWANDGGAVLQLPCGWRGGAGGVGVGGGAPAAAVRFTRPRVRHADEREVI